MKRRNVLNFSEASHAVLKTNQAFFVLNLYQSLKLSTPSIGTLGSTNLKKVSLANSKQQQVLQWGKYDGIRKLSPQWDENQNPVMK